MDPRAKEYRLKFIRNLDTLDEAARNHLLDLESEGERIILFTLALNEGFPGVAATLEVYHDNEKSGLTPEKLSIANHRREIGDPRQ